MLQDRFRDYPDKSPHTINKESYEDFYQRKRKFKGDPSPKNKHLYI